MNNIALTVEMLDGGKMFASFWMLDIFSRIAPETTANGDSNTNSSGSTSRDLQEVGLRVDDLMIAVPFGREEVLQTIGLVTPFDASVDQTEVNSYRMPVLAWRWSEAIRKVVLRLMGLRRWGFT